jgi:hypothetical protein
MLVAQGRQRCCWPGPERRARDPAAAAPHEGGSRSGRGRADGDASAWGVGADNSPVLSCCLIGE